ncbi:hypothetical protein [Acrididae reovirus]|nr:hypothetical protein [Acrididae reovirus]
MLSMSSKLNLLFPVRRRSKATVVNQDETINRITLPASPGVSTIGKVTSNNVLVSESTPLKIADGQNLEDVLETRLTINPRITDSTSASTITWTLSSSDADEVRSVISSIPDIIVDDNSFVSKVRSHTSGTSLSLTREDYESCYDLVQKTKEIGGYMQVVVYLANLYARFVYTDAMVSRTNPDVMVNKMNLFTKIDALRTLLSLPSVDSEFPYNTVLGQNNSLDDVKRALEYLPSYVGFSGSNAVDPQVNLSFSSQLNYNIDILNRTDSQIDIFTNLQFWTEKLENKVLMWIIGKDDDVTTITSGLTVQDIYNSVYGKSLMDLDWTDDTSEAGKIANWIWTQLVEMYLPDKKYLTATVMMGQNYLRDHVSATAMSNVTFESFIESGPSAVVASAKTLVSLKNTMNINLAIQALTAIYIFNIYPSSYNIGKYLLNNVNIESDVSILNRPLINFNTLLNDVMDSL